MCGPQTTFCLVSYFSVWRTSFDNSHSIILLEMTSLNCCWSKKVFIYLHFETYFHSVYDSGMTVFYFKYFGDVTHLSSDSHNSWQEARRYTNLWSAVYNVHLPPLYLPLRFFMVCVSVCVSLSRVGFSNISFRLSLF